MSEAKRDRWGRYKIVPPSGGKAVGHTRCTTVAKTLDDTTNLAKWAERHVAKGLTLRDDLFALAQATPLAEKSLLNRLCQEAKDAAAGGARANIGTALHAFTEQVDRGDDVTIPEPWDADVRAYRECLTEHGIEVDPDLIEVIAVCEALSEPVAGTIDRIVRWGNGNFIADLKTGSDLHFQWRGISAQLAVYSRAASLYDPESDSHLPMPPVDQDRGIVFHLPAGSGTCVPYLVDLNAGWRAAELAIQVRSWRKRADLAEPMAEAA